LAFPSLPVGSPCVWLASSGASHPCARFLRIARPTRSSHFALGDASRVVRPIHRWAPPTGLFKNLPLRRLSARCPLPHIAQRASVQRCHALNMFRPRGFSPPRRLPPPNRLRAYCIPHPTMRFTGLLLHHALASSLAFPPVLLPPELFPLK